MISLRRLSLYGILGVICAGVIIGSLQGAAIASVLDSWKVLPRPERLTELYFVTDKLPARLTIGQPQTVQFVVHNVEGRDTTYRYFFVAASPDGQIKQTLGAGSFRLAANESRATSRRITIPALGERTSVQVRLRYDGIARGHDQPSEQAQDIAYWVKLSATPKPTPPSPRPLPAAPR